MTPLRRRMTEDLILHNLSPKTIRLYINWVADYAKYFHSSPEQLGPEHVRSYLLHLVQERQASCNVLKQACLALKFLYRVTLGKEWIVDTIHERGDPPGNLIRFLNLTRVSRVDLHQQPSVRACFPHKPLKDGPRRLIMIQPAGDIGTGLVPSVAECQWKHVLETSDGEIGKILPDLRSMSKVPGAPDIQEEIPSSQTPAVTLFACH